MEKNGKWLASVLNANGFTLENLAEQTKLPISEIQKAAADQSADESVWNTILSTINEYPSLDYPSPQILQDIKNAMEEQGDDGRCSVYYGVSASDLIFTNVRVDSTMELFGASVPLDWLFQLNLTLAEAYELFTRQNCSLNG